MEISELILSHHFFDQDVRPPKKKKLNRRRSKRLKHRTVMVVGNGKTVPSNSADSWIRSKGYRGVLRNRNKCWYDNGSGQCCETGGMCRCPHYVS